MDYYSINKTELARQYGWTLNYLRTKINTTPGLVDELVKKADYNMYQRIFTPKQISIVYKYLGTPNELPLQMIKTSLSKKQIAGLYNISVRTLGRYLNTGHLFVLLNEKGYFKYQKNLQPSLTAIIFDYLGSPF